MQQENLIPSFPRTKPQFDRSDSHLAYLEPPHSHDPSSVSSIASLPGRTLDRLPVAVQLALYNLRQSTSIVYASYIRLQELLQERFGRLMPSLEVDGDITFSESSFFNYINSLCAERTYLISDAHPDWRHKASLAQVAIQPYIDLAIEPEPQCPGSPTSVLEWWKSLQSAVNSWCDYAGMVHVPDYEDTVGEYLAIQKQTPALTVDLDETPFETPVVLPTPPLGKEPDLLQLYQLRDRDFDTCAVSEHDVIDEAVNICTSNLAGDGKVARMVTQEFVLNDKGRVRDERKDSGIGLVE